jgi:hypothetical protein
VSKTGRLRQQVRQHVEIQGPRISWKMIASSHGTFSAPVNPISRSDGPEIEEGMDPPPGHCADPDFQFDLLRFHDAVSVSACRLTLTIEALSPLGSRVSIAFDRRIDSYRRSCECCLHSRHELPGSWQNETVPLFWISQFSSVVRSIHEISTSRSVPLSSLRHSPIGCDLPHQSDFDKLRT